MGDELNWTKAEDGVLLARYVSDGAAACARELGRDVKALCKRARRLGLVRKARWSTRDDAILQENWGDMDLRSIAKVLGRTELTTYWRAGHLGLARGCPQGFEYLTAAAERTGYSTDQLRRVLKWAAVPLRRTMSRPDVHAPRTFHCVVPFDVDEALASWHKTEPIDVAARRHGLDGATLKRWLRDARDAGTQMPPEPRKARVHWRIPSTTIDQVIAERHASETVRHAALRLGVDPMTLTGWLRSAGASKPPGWVWRLPRNVIDQVVADRVARGCRAKPATGRAA
jgi:transposase-like protein